MRRGTLPVVRCRYAGWQDIDSLAQWATEQSPPPESFSDIQGVFLTINEVAEESFLNFSNGRGDGQAVADRHIERRTEFYVDIDPVRNHVDGGRACASDDERLWAEAALETVMMVASLHGFPQPLVVDTGNGYQVYYRVDLPNDEGSKALIKSVLLAFASIVDCERGHVDKSVYNAARLARVPGSYNRKGVHTEERPYRLAAIAYAPANDVLQIADPSILESFVAWVANFAGGAGKTSVAATASSGRPPIETTILDQLVDEIKAYLIDNGAPPIKDVRRDADKTVLQFAYCPFRGPMHEDGGAAVLAWHNGGIGVHCFHDKCANESWESLQKLLGPAFRSDALAEFAGAHGNQIHRRYDDPLILAQAHIERSRLSDGAPGLAFVHSELYRYVPDAGWRQLSIRELQASVRDTIQRAYDADFLAKPLRKYSTPVGAGDINNTVKAVESIAYVAVDPAVSPPFWLTGDHQSNPLDLLVLKNGILDMRAWVEDRPHFFFPRTSQLFTEALGTYEYDPDCMIAPTWFAFLDSLEQPPEWLRYCSRSWGAVFALATTCRKYSCSSARRAAAKGPSRGYWRGYWGGKTSAVQIWPTSPNPLGWSKRSANGLRSCPRWRFPQGARMKLSQR